MVGSHLRWEIDAYTHGEDVMQLKHARQELLRRGYGAHERRWPDRAAHLIRVRNG